MDWASSPVWQEDPEGAQCNLNSNKISVVWWGDKRKCPLLQQCRLPSLPKKKTATQSTFYPHFLADPFASSKFNVTETFWQSHFASSKLNVTKNWYWVIPTMDPALSFGAGYHHMPHSKSKGLEQLLPQNIKHQQTC